MDRQLGDANTAAHETEARIPITAAPRAALRCSVRVTTAHVPCTLHVLRTLHLSNCSRTHTLSLFTSIAIVQSHLLQNYFFPALRNP